MQKAQTQRPVSRIDYSKLNSPEQLCWKAHRELLLQMRPSDRGCIGLAMVVEAMELSHSDLVPDKHIRWASLVDVPQNCFRRSSASGRGARWATIRPTTMQFGVPTLKRGTETHSWDFGLMPYDRYELPGENGRASTFLTPSPDTLNSAEHQQYFRVFNALEWAMTSHAFAFRPYWKQHREKFYEALHLPPVDEPLLVFGSGTYHKLAPPDVWMPRAYLAFRAEDRQELFDRATQRALKSVDIPPVYSHGMRIAFVTAMQNYLEYRAKFSGIVTSIRRGSHLGIPTIELTLSGDSGEHDVIRFYGPTAYIHVKVGERFHGHRFMNGKEEPATVLGEERFLAQLPSSWNSMSYQTRWERQMYNLLAMNLDPVMRFWFEREAVFTGQRDLVHYPAQISSVAAMSSAVDSGLMWDFSPAGDYFHDDAEACVFPTLPIGNWEHLSGSLPGDVLYDFTPADNRVMCWANREEPIERRRQSRRHSRA